MGFRTSDKPIIPSSYNLFVKLDVFSSQNFMCSHSLNAEIVKCSLKKYRNNGDDISLSLRKALCVSSNSITDGLVCRKIHFYQYTSWE